MWSATEPQTRVTSTRSRFLPKDIPVENFQADYNLRKDGIHYVPDGYLMQCLRIFRELEWGDI
jgi:hypothetical protein